MPKLGKTSEDRLATCDPRLQLIVREAIKIYDFSVLCGVRDKTEQDKAFTNGNSKVKWPESKHNLKPGRNEKYSLAVDLAPYPLNWNSLKEFYFLAGVIMAIASSKNIKVRWGGDFNRDYNLSNDKFIDVPHFEIDE